MVLLLRGAEFGLTGFGLLVVGRPSVFGDVLFRMFADLTVGVTIVGGGRKRIKETNPFIQRGHSKGHRVLSGYNNPIMEGWVSG